MYLYLLLSIYRELYTIRIIFKEFVPNKSCLPVSFQDLLVHKEREVPKVSQVQQDHQVDKVSRAYKGKRDPSVHQVQEQKTL